MFMKPIKITLAVLLLLSVCLLNAQQNTKKEERKYRVHLVTEDNGKTEVIDKEFATKEEMEAYMKQQEAAMPELPDLPERPEMPEPPLPPTPPSVEDHPVIVNVICADTGHHKKIIVINKEVVGEDGDPEIEVNVTDGDEQIEKTITKTKDDQGKIKTEVVVIKKVIKAQEEGHAKGPVIEKEIVPATNEKAANISGLNFYPNPNDGRFYVSFNVAQAADVTLRITDINGREVYRDTKTNFNGLYEKNFYEGRWESGVYLMEVTAGNEKQSLKITVQE